MPSDAFDTAWASLAKSSEFVAGRDTNGQAVFYAANMNKGQDKWFYYAVGKRVHRRPK